MRRHLWAGPPGDGIRSLLGGVPHRGDPRAGELAPGFIFWNGPRSSTEEWVLTQWAVRGMDALTDWGGSSRAP